MKPATLAPKFGLLRTPLLPFETLEALTAGLAPGPAARDAVRARLLALLERPELAEALFLSSSSLWEAVSAWRSSASEDLGVKVERALVRYVQRLAGRAEPFGLLATVSLVLAGPGPGLRLGNELLRHTTIDVDVLEDLCAALSRTPEVRNRQSFRPNATLSRGFGGYRLTVSRPGAEGRSLELSSVSDEEPLPTLVRRAEKGATRAELIATARAHSPEVSEQEVSEYVDVLLDEQILVAELVPTLTGPDPLARLATQLAGLPAADVLASVSQALHRLDHGGSGQELERYHQLRATLASLGEVPSPAQLLHVTSARPVEGELPAALLGELSRALRLVNHLSCPGSGELAELRERFVARFGEEEVPLLTAVDEERGLAVGMPSADDDPASPLLSGLPLGKREAATFTWGRREELLQRWVEAGRGGTLEVQVDEAELTALKPPLPLPEDGSAMIRVAAADAAALGRGELVLQLLGAAGPASRTLARFGHVLPGLAERLRERARADEARYPDSVTADIIHQPTLRAGPVCVRPCLYSYELEVFGASGAEPSGRLTLDDLFVSVRQNRFRLTSRRLGREVRVLQSSAYGGDYGPPAYRFLYLLCFDGIQGAVRFRWDPVKASFYPRVRCGKVLLSPARWDLPLERLGLSKTADEGKDFARVTELRRAHGWPRWLALADGEGDLPVDLDNSLMVASMVQTARSQGRLELSELFPSPEQLVVRGAGGRYVSQLIVPFERAWVEGQAPAQRPSASSANVGRPNPARYPGSEWSYVHLYCGPATADAVLVQAVVPLVERLRREGTCARWFFIRYGDPEWHLRVRIQGDPARVQRELWAAFEPLQRPDAVWRMCLDTYLPETYRYGGPEALELCEDVFCADSDAAGAIAALHPGQDGLDARWRLALAGMKLLAEDFGYDLSAQRELARHYWRAMLGEHTQTAALTKRVGERYRPLRAEVEALFAGTAPDELRGGLEALAARSPRTRPAFERLRALERDGRLAVSAREVLQSILHMHVNRVLRSGQRAQELVLYGFWERATDSLLHRGGR